MKRIAIFLACLCLAAPAARADYLGSWAINDYLTFRANTHRLSSGAAYNASSITYRIYEDDTATEIITDTAMTQFDSETGFYLNKIQLLAATGFEAGKCYTILVKATVDGVAGACSHTFQIGLNVNKIAGNVLPTNVNNVFSNVIEATGAGTALYLSADGYTKLEDGAIVPGTYGGGLVGQTADIADLLGTPVSGDFATNIEAIKAVVDDVVADTALWDTTTEARTVLTGGNFEVATEPNLTTAAASALAAQTAAEKIDTASELRTLLVGTNVELATEPNQTAAHAILTDLGGISQIGDKVQADMDANSLLVNWTAARAAIVTDLAGLSEIGDKVVADMDANSTSLDILTDLGGISQVGDKVVADMDANSVKLTGIQNDTDAWDTAAEARTLLVGANVELATEPNQTTTLTNVAAILADTGTDGVKIAAGNQTFNITGNLSGSVGSVTAGVTVTTNNDKTGYKLASDGLNSVATTAPTGVPTNFREMMVMLYRRFYHKVTMTSTVLSTYADDNTTALTEQALSDTGAIQVMGPAQAP